MNSYLSREEKEHFVRTTALAALLEATINGYASAKSTDPNFLKFLRTGRTMIGKALTMRGDALEPAAKEEFYKQTGRLEFICVPTAEAKKAHNELIALKTTVPMEIHDFEDWYCAVIETTCKKCCTEQYAECHIRGILTKYGVYPIDPAAVGKCQFNYVGTPEAEELQTVDNSETVPAALYNMAVSELAALKLKTSDEYLPQIASLNGQLDKTEERLSVMTNQIASHEDVCKELNSHIDNWQKQYVELEIKLIQGEEKFKNDLGDMLNKINERDKEIAQLQVRLQATAAFQEQPKEKYPVSIGLASGGEFDYVLPAGMTEIMIREIQQPRQSRSTCAQYVAGTLIAIDLQEVIALQVDKLPPKDWVKPKEIHAVPVQQEKYRVECKCGAEYYAEMNASRTKAWCRECKTVVFADRLAEASTADGTAATLLTNRYWVEREQPTEQRWKEISAPKISDNFGKEYKDPINPLA